MEALVEAGVDVIVGDTAHGTLLKIALERVRWDENKNFPQVTSDWWQHYTRLKGDALALLDADSAVKSEYWSWFYLYNTYCGWYRYARNFCNLTAC